MKIGSRFLMVFLYLFILHALLFPWKESEEPAISMPLIDKILTRRERNLN